MSEMEGLELYSAQFTTTVSGESLVKQSNLDNGLSVGANLAVPVGMLAWPCLGSGWRTGMAGCES